MHKNIFAAFFLSPGNETQILGSPFQYSLLSANVCKLAAQNHYVFRYE